MAGRTTALVLTGLLIVGATACSAEDDTAAAGGTITMGFSQVGSESGWRTANTKSIQDAAAAAGITLRFANAEQKQEAQISAIRGFIAEKVDVIGFSPVVESGWDKVLQEAKDAGIPVILTDRAIDSTDTTLYRSFLGSDFLLEGRRAGEWLVQEYRDRPGAVSIVELQGTTGSAPANQRRAGFTEVIKADPKFTVIASKDALFTRVRGREVMEGFLRQHPDIDVLYAHNDDMGLGAIQAIEAAGKKPGVDIKIITVDAIRDGLTALAAGKINFIVECSPLIGPQLMELAKKVVNGEPVPGRVVTEETVFTAEKARAELATREY